MKNTIKTIVVAIIILTLIGSYSLFFIDFNSYQSQYADTDQDADKTEEINFTGPTENPPTNSPTPKTPPSVKGPKTPPPTN